MSGSPKLSVVAQTEYGYCWSSYKFRSIRFACSTEAPDSAERRNVLIWWAPNSAVIRRLREHRRSAPGGLRRTGFTVRLTKAERDFVGRHRIDQASRNSRFQQLALLEPVKRDHDLHGPGSSAGRVNCSASGESPKTDPTRIVARTGPSSIRRMRVGRKGELSPTRGTTRWPIVGRVAADRGVRCAAVGW